MAIFLESLRLRHMPLDWVGHLVRAGSRIVTKLYKHMVPFQSARIVLGLKVSYNPTVIDGAAVCNLSQLDRMGLKFCRMASHRHQLWCNFDAIKLD